MSLIYTHYWEPKRVLTTKENLQILEVAKDIVSKGNVKVEFEIRHNRFYLYEPGDEYSLKTFTFPTREEFLCKTGRQPFDRLVTAILIASAAIAPGAFVFWSDGAEEDWIAGLALATECAPKCLTMKIPHLDLE